MLENEKVTNEELARIISKGFDGIENRFNSLENRFDGLENRFDGLTEKLNEVDLRVSRVENNVYEIKKGMIKRIEFDDALSRIKLAEKKLSIESGK